ncbi:uncharacterized protein J4E84_004286 [Alternaria hordeiaustralica]|uniref:uncharacterized protein n=1 Tax=Alternaria hordeiaustralica TaxID=1187925 RepID=UPI0020C2C29B|nr:uncharacterized protein J4E84_004286 [Alternaria hordeiaustralica]KAI4690105.1 hypothetical protein J4E84_004286 [Alternaria hordeiaustralica]
MSTPGRIVEWTASDGRKGRLTGTGKPRLTAASLAKVPSERQPAKELAGAKNTPKKAASTKPATDGDNLWGNDGWGDTNAKSESKKSSSKKASSNQGDGWVVQESGNDTNDPFAATWGTTPDATGGDDNKEKKDEPAAPWEATNVPDNNTVPEDDGKKDGESNGWTKEQDEKLIQLKTKTSKSWAQMGEEIGGKTKQDCIDRFKEIQPKGYKANEANQGGGGKKGKKGKKTDQHDGNNKDDTKKEEKKEEETGDDGGLLGLTFGEDTSNGKDESGDKNNSGDKAPDVWGGTVSWDYAGGDAAGTGTNAWETQVGWGTGATTGGEDGANDAAASWDNIGGNNRSKGTNNNQKNNTGGGAGDAKASRQKATSNKVPPRASPQPNANNGNNNNARPIAARPLELEVKPDDTFSADDLRLVARILQQDCSMVWNRVSWRFRDKTGRTLHPDEFEKKITGRLEGKGSENGERRR